MADLKQSGIDTDFGAYSGGDVGLSKEPQTALGTDMSDPVSKYFKQMKDYTSQERKTAQEAQKDIIGKQIQMEQNRLTQEADLAKRQAGEMSGIMSQYGKQLMAEPPKRQIEKDTMEGMIGLGALLPIAGAFFGGKGLTSATGALNAMAGLVKGYQEGNKDRIAFEQKKYDDAMREFERHQQQIKSAFDLAIKKAQVNQTSALAELKMKLYAENAPMLAELAEKQGIVKTSEDNINMYNNFLKQKMQYEEKINQAKEIQKIKSEGTSGRDAYGFNEIVTTAANEAAASISNIVNMNPSVSTGLFGGRQTTSPFTAPIDALTNSITSDDVQRYNVEIANFGKFIAQLQKGGRAVTNYDILNASQQFAIKMGDSPLTVLTRLAQMRQSAERAIDVRIESPKTPESLKQILRQNKNEIQDAIPFTVNDVNNFANKQSGTETFVDYIKKFKSDSSGSSNSDGWILKD